MRTIKKLLIAICALWAGSSQAVTADDQLNYIYAEKGRLNIHIGTVPDQFQSIRLPIWSDQKGQDDLIWYPVQRGERGFDLQVPLTNHQDQAGLYHVHVYGQGPHGELVGLFPLTTTVEKKDLAASQPTISIQQVSSHEFDVKLKLFEDVEEVLFPIWSDQDGQDDLVWYPAKKIAPGQYQLRFHAQNHKGKGLFHLHVYQKNKGQVKGLLPTSFQVQEEKPRPLITHPDNFYPVGECTWGTKELAPWAQNWWGNGGMWAASARAAGFRTGNTPEVGAIVCWDDGGYGHVGLVTDVEHEQKIQIQEANYNGNRTINNFRGWFDPTNVVWGTVSYIYPN